MWSDLAMTETVLFSETIPGGASWSMRVKRGNGIRLTDLQGGANASVLLHRSDDPLERYNLPDTLKAQFIAFVTAPFVLYSDMGHILASVVHDNLGWHDAITGASDAESVLAKFGEGRYQSMKNERHTNARDHFLVELGKYGLGERDLVPPVNFFTKVAPDAEGSLSFVEGHARAGASVTLRMEMDVLVTISVTPHPMDPSTAWAPKPVMVDVLKFLPPCVDDASRTVREQNRRGFALTERLYL
jgi:uncharacterized protein